MRLKSMILAALLLACALAPAHADPPAVPPSSLGGGVARCSASWSYIDGVESSTSLSTTRATLGLEHDDVTELDPDSCWSMPTADVLELRLDASGAVDWAFDVHLASTLKRTGTATALLFTLDTRQGASCATGAVTAAKSQVIEAGVLFTAFPALLGSVTLSDGERLCANVATTADTATLAVRHFNLVIRRK